MLSTASFKGSCTRDVILRAAIELYATEGYANVGMRKLAEQAKILPGSLYAHFSSKSELLYEIIYDFESRLLSVVERGLRKVRRADRLRVYIESILTEVVSEELSGKINRFDNIYLTARQFETVQVVREQRYSLLREVICSAGRGGEGSIKNVDIDLKIATVECLLLNIDHYHYMQDNAAGFTDFLVDVCRSA